MDKSQNNTYIISKELIETYDCSLPLYKKIHFITNFIYKNININNTVPIHQIEEFESDYEEVIEDESYNSEYYSD